MILADYSAPPRDDDEDDVPTYRALPTWRCHRARKFAGGGSLRKARARISHSSYESPIPIASLAKNGRHASAARISLYGTQSAFTSLERVHELWKIYQRFGALHVWYIYVGQIGVIVLPDILNLEFYIQRYLCTKRLFNRCIARLRILCRECCIIHRRWSFCMKIFVSTHFMKCIDQTTHGNNSIIYFRADFTATLYPTNRNINNLTNSVNVLPVGWIQMYASVYYWQNSPVKYWFHIISIINTITYQGITYVTCA